jgi:hypothetical protein
MTTHSRVRGACFWAAEKLLLLREASATGGQCLPGRRCVTARIRQNELEEVEPFTPFSGLGEPSCWILLEPSSE